MPEPQKPRQPPPVATKPPLHLGFKSPWVGKTVEDCAKWLQQAPTDENNVPGVNTSNFVVMNEWSKDEDIAFACRIKNGDGGIKVEYFPQPTGEIALQMFTNDGMKWDEKASNYQRGREALGMPDRSKARPYDNGI